MNKNYTHIYIKERNKIILIIIILIFLLIFLSYILFNNLIIKPNGDENITTKIKNDEDFLNWFIEFDNLYNKKVKSPKYSLTKESFQEINNFLNNNKTSDIYFKDNIYYLNESITIELDAYTRSFRYTKYENNNKKEILEVNLINGKYYVQLINTNYLYKISFNKEKISKNKEKNKGNITIKDSIFNTNDFKW